MKQEISEDLFAGLTPEYVTRMAQIIISKKRFDYLAADAGHEFGNFVVYDHKGYNPDLGMQAGYDGYFSIYDRNTMKCLVRFFYSICRSDEKIHAVICWMQIDDYTLREQYRLDGFMLVCDLIDGKYDQDAASDESASCIVRSNG